MIAAVSRAALGIGQGHDDDDDEESFVASSFVETSYVDNFVVIMLGPWERQGLQFYLLLLDHLLLVDHLCSRCAKECRRSENSQSYAILSVLQ